MGGKRKSVSSSNKGGTPTKKPKRALASHEINPKNKITPKKPGKETVPVDEGEESFPRGGQQPLTPLERSIIKTQAQQDILFNEEATAEERVEEKETKTMARKKPKKQTSRKLDILNIKKLVPGMLVLGAVLEVHEYNVVFSLPFNMRGTVAISDVSDHMTKLVELETQSQEDEGDQGGGMEQVLDMERLFSVGQLMPCYVQAVDGPRISLSVNPRLVNSHLTAKDIKQKLLLPGSVKSIEDHGYIIDFSVEDKTGFLLEKNAAEFIKKEQKGRSLCVGQVVSCLILAGPDARTVSVAINPSQVGVAMVSPDHMIGMGALLPGLLVKATIKEVASNGLLMSFLDGFEGVVSPRHLSCPHIQSLEEFTVNKKLKGRVLWVNVSAKTVGLTLQQELVEGKPYKFDGVEIGDIYRSAKVISVDFISSLFLELGSNLIGYSPPGMVTDEPKSVDSVPIKDRKQYKKGTLHDVRVVQFNLIDRVAIVSLQESVLEKPYMKFSDITVGDYIEGKVEIINTFGMIISVTQNIRGLCPTIHISDLKTITHKPRNKYKQGSKVKCRVVNVDPSQKRLMLTCKKTFMCRSEVVLSDYSQVELGACYNGVISSVRHYGCIVHFFGHVKGLVRKSDLSATSVITDPTSAFWVGQPVECRVLECDVSAGKLLLSFILNPVDVEGVDETCAEPAELESRGEDAAKKGRSQVISEKESHHEKEDFNLMDVVLTETLNRCERSFNGERIYLSTLPTLDYQHQCGTILAPHKTQLENSLKEGKAYTISDPLVLCGQLTFKPSFAMLKSAHTHSKLKGYVATINDHTVEQNLKKLYGEGQLVHCRMKQKGKKQTYDLFIGCPIHTLSEGAATRIVPGHAYQVISSHALLVATPIGMGRVDITDVSDNYQKDPFNAVKEADNLLQCYLIRMEGEKLDLSLRGSRTRPGGETEVEIKDPEIQGLEDLVVNQKVRGYVKAITDVGVYVRLGRNIDGRVQITHLVDGFVKNFKKIYSLGDLVTAMVIKVDRVSGKVDLSLRLSLVDPEAAKKLRAKKEKEEKKKKKKREALNSDGGSPEPTEDVGCGGDDESDDEGNTESSSSSEEDSEDSGEDDGISEVDPISRPTLQVTGGFRWDVGGGDQNSGADIGDAVKAVSNSDSEEEELEELEVTSKKSRRQKKAAKKEEEVALYQKEQSLLETGKEPESAEDFDRLLLATPNNSALWVQYIAFYLHTAEVDKARTIAQRALRTISFREEGERLNVWVGWMNLENLYGTQETLIKVFESALQKNEPLEVYKRLAAIYEQSKKHELSNQLYQTMTKKFSGSQWVWSEYMSYLMRQGKHGQARTLLQRALKSLPSKQQHVSLISKLSQLEFKYGEPERGRTMFESLLSTYPRKMDIWSVYIDMLLKMGDHQKVRDVFEQAIHLKISAKKMKFIFKRYMEFENKHGTPRLVEEVVEKARSFVQSYKTQ